jgi:cyclopropane-fatty-acyl-phospholipid synthase
MAENKAEKPLRFIGYAQTLVEWRRRFRAAWPQVARLGFDDRFKRL